MYVTWNFGADNILIYIPFSSHAQYAVLQKLGIQTLFAVVGFSMGGQQVSLPPSSQVRQFSHSKIKAYYWPVVYPDYVERKVILLGENDCELIRKLNSYVCICGSARTSPHNQWLVHDVGSVLRR